MIRYHNRIQIHIYTDERKGAGNGGKELRPDKTALSRKKNSLNH